MHFVRLRIILQEILRNVTPNRYCILEQDIYSLVYLVAALVHTVTHNFEGQKINSTPLKIIDTKCWQLKFD